VGYEPKSVKKLISQILASILGFFLATQYILGVGINIIPGGSEIFGFKITVFWQILIILGIILGLTNFFLKPILKIITFPLHFLSLGLSSILINLGIVWLVSLAFEELIFLGFLPLLWTTLLISVLNLLFSTFLLK